jgi:hypothetical protein
VSQPSDPAEREADAMAARALAAIPSPAGGGRHPGGAAAPAARIHRACAACAEGGAHDHGGGGGDDDEDGTKAAVHRHGAGAPAVTPQVAASVKALGGGGEPLPAGERRFFEQGFGHELSRVRIHDDPPAAMTARALRADAFTFRNDVAFAAGRYRPGSDEGRRLLAHELAHVIQQGEAPPLGGAGAAPGSGVGGGPRIARREEEGEGARPPAPLPARPVTSPAAPTAPDADFAVGGGLIVEDDAETLTAGQERKTTFLAELRVQACAAADRALARAGRDTRGCPHVERLLNHYTNRPASHLERGIRKFVPGSVAVRSAREYIPLVAERMARGVETWVQTGEIPRDIPDELRAELPGGGGIAGMIGGALSSVAGAIGGALSAIGGLFFKEAPGGGGARAGADRGALEARLGPGRPLQGAARTRMEGAFGQSFGGVRVHEDAGASRLARDLGARAFTLGSHVAFADGQYRPGTPVGDALLAHELAHVVQQGQQGSGPAPAPAASPSAAPAGAAAIGLAEAAVEDDADRAAVGAMTALYAPEQTSGGSRPRLRSGLRLSRCQDGKTPESKVPDTESRKEAQGAAAGQPQPEPEERAAPEEDQTETIDACGGTLVLVTRVPRRVPINADDVLSFINQIQERLGGDPHADIRTTEDIGPTVAGGVTVTVTARVKRPTFGMGRVGGAERALIDRAVRLIEEHEQRHIDVARDVMHRAVCATQAPGVSRQGALQIITRARCVELPTAQAQLDATEGLIEPVLNSARTAVEDVVLHGTTQDYRDPNCANQ